MKHTFELESLEMTCSACPSQWEGRLTDGRWLYVRFRFGNLTIGVGDSVDQAVDATLGGPGISGAIYNLSDEWDGELGTDGMIAALRERLDIDLVLRGEGGADAREVAR